MTKTEATPISPTKIRVITYNQLSTIYLFLEATAAGGMRTPPPSHKKNKRILKIT